MTYTEALESTYAGNMITRTSFDSQVYIIRDLSAGGDSPPLYYSDESGVKLYSPTTNDTSATDWETYTFEGR